MINNKYLSSIALIVSFAVFVFMNQGQSSLTGQSGTIPAADALPTTSDTQTVSQAAPAPVAVTAAPAAPAPKKTTTTPKTVAAARSGDDDSDNPTVKTTPTYPSYPTYTPPPVATTPTPAPTPAPAPVAPVVAPTTPPAPKQTGQYKDGSYTGSQADAYYGTVQVQAIISGGRLNNVQILSYPSDRSTSQRINQRAMPTLVSEAIQAQSASVNTVSGASDSSAAFRQSLGSALSQAANS
jgi:uncharacterized protein with FMN-binding domain